MTDRAERGVQGMRSSVMSGTALIREVRALRRALPILLASGYLGAGVVNRTHNAGADEVLKKPLLAGELAASLARVFQEH